MAPTTASASEGQPDFGGTPKGHNSTCTMPFLMGTNQAKTRPAAVPPKVNSSGRMRASKSENVSPTNNALKTQNFRAGRSGPSRQTQTKNRTPVNSSTTG